MISVDKTKIQKPKSIDYNWINSELLDIKDKIKPGDFIKNKYKTDEIKDSLKELYNSKCAYCEVIKPEGYNTNVEHFRPKNGIKEVINHKGYFWLAYEWTNLMLVCESCNIYKSNKFPIKNESLRISDDLIKEDFLRNNEFVFENFEIQKLKKEECLMLNPEIDNIEEHLKFLHTGEIEGITEKGKKTIEVCKLNRASLTKARRKIIDDFVIEIIDIFKKSDETELKILLKYFFETKLIYNSKLEYSRFRFFIFLDFENFVIDEIKKENFEYSKILKIIFDDFKNQKIS